MPRANAPTRSLDELTVGELRAVLAAGDESVTIAVALANLTEANRVSAAHELDVREYNAYVDRRAARRASALVEAATAADKANRGRGDGERMAGRLAARLERDEEFEDAEPLLDFEPWKQLGRPEVHEAGVVQRVVAKAKAVIA